MKKTICILLCFIVLIPLFSSCTKEDVAIDTNKSYTQKYEKSAAETNYIQIEIVGGATIIIELYPDIAPLTVANFKKLVGEGFYDGLIFHRVIENFMIQSGDPQGTGMGGSLETIKGEFSRNGVANDLLHERGVISMARKGNPHYDSASSQFFIVHKDAKSLNGEYAAFGRVIFGMETVDQIAVVDTNKEDKPLEDVKIKTIYFIDKPQ